MVGGLIQIANYASQDIFLTGTPQITFFKLVYRRHTNFAVEPIHQDFIGYANFGQEMTCVIDKFGDLMNRVYLEIELPRVNLLKNPCEWDLDINIIKKQLDDIQIFYFMVRDYISTNIDTIKKLDLLLKASNISLEDIKTIFKDDDFLGILRDRRQQILKQIGKNDNNIIDLICEWQVCFCPTDAINEQENKTNFLLRQINRFDIETRFNSIAYSKINLLANNSEQRIRSELKRIIKNNLYSEMKNFYTEIYNVYLDKQKIYQSLLDKTHTERYKFAWVEEIGHAIVDHVELRIGNQIIDKQTGDWLIIYNKLFTNDYQIENYYKMIGNVNELIIFNDEIKNTYKLIIPMRFWFCRYIGQSLPLIALRYHDVVFNFRLKNLNKLCYVEDDPSLLDIDNLQSQYNINLINANLYVDYIFLDTDERRRFAQTTHEYLIEMVQYNEFTDITGNNFRPHLVFSHPTKYIIWFFQPIFYRENPSGRNKCQWNNFGTNPNRTGYTLESSYLRVNTYNRTDDTLNIKYYNYLQPYLYFTRSPTDGLYLYSFSIEPMIQQPSGTLNLSRIDDLSIFNNFTEEFTRLISDNNAYMAAYVVSYNILRLFGGMAGLAFQNDTF